MTQGIITIEDFQKVQLRTARVTEAEKVEGTDKLLRLEIDLGDQSRQIVAGIAPYYETEDLVGKVIIVVTNLKPVTIRGVESNGMLLAATRDDSVVLVTVDDPSVGAGVPIS